MADGGLRIGARVIGASAVLGGTLLIGRFSGLVREFELASAFGVSSSADAAVLLLTLPDLLVNLLLSGGLAAALIPRLRALEPHDAAMLLRQAGVGVVGVFGLFAALLFMTSESFFLVLAPGLPSTSLPPSAAVLATALAIPLTAASGVTTAGLNSMQRYLVAGCGTVFFNLVVIASLWGGRAGLASPLVALGIGIAAGAALRLATQLAALPRGSLLGPTWSSPPDSAFLRAFLAAATAASLMLLVPVIVRSLASTVAPGAIAALNYAFKLVELPAGVLVTSISAVALTRLSQFHASNDAQAAGEAYRSSTQRSVVNALGAGLVMAYFADSIVEVAFGRGAMARPDLDRVTALMRITLVGLPFLALSGMAMADLNARQRPKDVLKATVGCLLLLPLLAYPGVQQGSERLLALAVVAFQFAHATWLLRVGGHPMWGAHGWFNARMLSALATGVVVVASAVMVDSGLLLPQQHLSRLLLACSAVLAAIVASQRVLAMQFATPDAHR